MDTAQENSVEPKPKFKYKWPLITAVFVLAAIPLTVVSTLTVRDLSPKAASGQPTSLTPAYSVSTINPTFSWDCYCYTTLYRVNVREGDGNFLSGSWYKDVPKGTTNVTRTSFTGFSNNNYKTPIPGSMSPGKTYFWTVSCVTGGCTTAATQSFTVVNTVSMPVNLRVTVKDSTGVTIAWDPSSSPFGINHYGLTAGFCCPTTTTTSYKITSFIGTTSHNIGVHAVDNNGEFSPEAVISVTQPDRDFDGDGFLDSKELKMGTSPTSKCGSSAWPPDFDDSKSVTSVDYNSLAAQVGRAYNKRYDLTGDGVVNPGDQALLSSYLGKTCS